VNRLALTGGHTATAGMPLEITPLAFRDACDLVDALHRHHARSAFADFASVALVGAVAGVWVRLPDWRP
jgi:hypothetical protein